MLKKDLLPIKNFKQAAILAPLLFLLLVAIRHPVEELAVAAAVLYVFLWLSKEVIERLVMYVMHRQVRLCERIARRFVDGSLEEPSLSPRSAYKAGVVLAIIAIILELFAIVGAGFTLGNVAASGMGLTPLSGYLAVIAIALFLVGGVCLSLILGLMTLALVIVDNLSASVTPKFGQFHAVTREVDYRLRRRTLTRPSPAAF